MFQLSRPVRILCEIVSAATIFTAGCGSKSPTPIVVGNIVSINPTQLLAGISNSILQPITRSLGGWEWSGFINSFGSLLTSFRYTLDMQKVTYQSIGADGKTYHDRSSDSSEINKRLRNEFRHLGADRTVADDAPQKR